MLTIDNLILLVKNYLTEHNKNCFEDAIDLASKEFNNMLDETLEYPLIIYCFILENMDNTPKNN